ncbi:MAG: SDR family NAD(P)-dependent oxidoreductase, partial [Candidatus Wallbacteria bacterium]|nr:SDR family NAD(P)-dependent oxidoreductase [Candidatus Wallbacteria bacterium]
MDLQGKAALVTGAGKRVGRAIALELARRGADLAVHYNRSAVEAAQVVAEARALGVSAEKFRAELASETSVDRMFAAVTQQFPRLAVLVNSAAVFFPTPLDALDGK